MSSFQNYIKLHIEKMMSEVSETIRTGVKKYYPPQIIEYVEYECVKKHTRCGQDIHGTVDFKRGEIVHLKAETEKEHGYIIDLANFIRYPRTVFLMK